MLVGYPPFFAENPSQTCKKVLDWKNTFIIPKEAHLSDAAEDLLRKLMCDQSIRLGVNGVEEIKAHPFFAGVNWKRMREVKAPNIDRDKSKISASYFYI